MRNLSLFATPTYRPFSMLSALESLDKDFFTEASKNFGTKTMSYDMRLNSEKSQWELTLELAGVPKDKLSLDVKEGHLQISGEKTKGLNTGQFDQAFKLPDGIDYEKIEADFTDGILVMTLPLAEKKTVKRIELK